MLSISVGAWACSATRSLYAEQNRPTGRIAFVRGNFGDSGNRKIYLMNPDGSDVRPLTETEGAPGEDRPSWSPDSTSIAFAARERICVCSLNGSNLRILTPTAMQAGAPTWSPDATRIAFHAWNPDRSSSQIYTMKSDGTDVRQLTKLECYNWLPCWCPDNKRIVFESTMRGNRDILSISIDGSNQINLTNAPGTDHAPACSPDGKRIAIASGRGYGNLDVCLMGVDGSGFVNLSKSESRDSEPTWAPDGKWLAFARSDGKSPPMDICVMQADGSNVSTITANDGDTENWGPSWGAP
jgi:TolB protein